MINGKPVKLADLRACIEVIRGLANGEAVEYKGSTLRFPWNPAAACRSGSPATGRTR